MNLVVWIRRASWAAGVAGLLITILAPGWVSEPGPPDPARLTSGTILLISTAAAFLAAARTVGTPEYHFSPWGLVPPGTFLLLSYSVMSLSGALYDRPLWSGLYLEHALMAAGLIAIGVGVRGWAEVMSPRPRVAGTGRILAAAVVSLAMVGAILTATACLYSGGCGIRKNVLPEYLIMDLVMFTLSLVMAAWLLRSPVLSRFPESFSPLISIYILFPLMSLLSVADDLIDIPGAQSEMAMMFYYFLAPPLLAAGIFSTAPNVRAAGDRVGDGPSLTLAEICPEWRDAEGELEFLRSVSHGRVILLVCHAGSPLMRAVESSDLPRTVALMSAGVDHPEMVAPLTFRVAPEPAQIINLMERVRRSSGPLTLVVDNLTDLITLGGVESTYKVVRVILEELRESDAAVFLMAPAAHDGRVVTTFRLLLPQRVSLCPAP